MQIISINRAQKRQIEFNGEQIDTGIFKTAVSGKVPVSRYGIEGDVIADPSVHGGLDQAVYMYSTEDYQWWSAKLGKELRPGSFGENLTTEGLDLRALKIGDRLTICTVVLEISAPRTPCFKLAVKMGDTSFVKQFARAARPGAYARVLQEGVIVAGDSLALEKTAEDYAGVVEVFEAWHAKDPAPALFLKALRSPIAAVHRQRIQEWYDATGHQAP
jgi:MOSC domain-containing protein YiiM